MTGLTISILRVAAVAAASVAAGAVPAALGYASPFPPTPLIAVMAMPPVNLATPAAVRRSGTAAAAGPGTASASTGTGWAATSGGACSG